MQECASEPAHVRSSEAAEDYPLQRPFSRAADISTIFTTTEQAENETYGLTFKKLPHDSAGNSHFSDLFSPADGPAQVLLWIPGELIVFEWPHKGS